MSEGEKCTKMHLAKGNKVGWDLQRSNTLARWFGNVAPDLFLGRWCLLEVVGRVEAYARFDYDLL